MIKVNAKQLHADLKMGAANGRGKLPVLNCALLYAADGILSATTTDMGQHITTRTEAQTDEELRCLPNAVELIASLNGLDGDVTLSINEKDKNLLSVRAGRRHYRIAMQNPDDFPNIPSDQFEPKNLDCAELARAISEVQYAMAAKDGSRHYLEGVCLDKTDIVAADGHRMAWVSVQTMPQDQIIIPRNSVASIVRAMEMDGATFSATDSLIKISSPACSVTTHLIDNQFPEWRHIVKREFPHVATFKSSEAVPAIKRTMRMANKYNSIELIAKEGGFSVVDHLIGEKTASRANDWFSAEISDEFPEIYKLSANYLLDAMQNEHITLRTSGNESPCLIEVGDSDAKHIIMPIGKKDSP